MAKYTSGRQKNLKVGISSYSENTQVLGVIGRVGIGSTIFDADYDLDVRGTTKLSGNIILGNTSFNLINVPGRISSNFYPDGDGTYDIGRAPQIGLGANRWKDANFLGIGKFDGGVDAHDLELGVGSANLIYSTSGNLELNSQSGTTNIDDILTVSGNTGIGTTNPKAKLDVVGNVNISGIITTTSINFASGGLLGDPYGDGGFGLKSAPNQYATIASNNLQQYIQVDNTTTYIGTGYGSTTGTYDWQFKKDGSTQFPNGLILAPPGQSITLQSDQYSQLMWMNDDQTVGPDKFTNVDFFVASGYAILDIGYRDGASNQQYKSWGWSLNGLQFPDLTIQETAFTGYAPTAGIATYALNAGISTSVIGGIGSITSLTVSGIVTSNAYYIGTSQVVSSARQLQNIASLDSTTTATIETAIQQAPNDFTSLNISGISTLQSTTLIGGGTSTGTVSQLLQVTGGAYVSGNLGIGTTNSTSKLHVIGDTYISGILTATDINSASDIRLKTNIKPFENALEKIVQINGVSFDWIENNAKSGGIIAQDVEKVFPELVNDGNHKTVNYNGLIGVLVESIKELKQEIEDLKSRLP
jgi:hypothetical protein